MTESVEFVPERKRGGSALPQFQRAGVSPRRRTAFVLLLDWVNDADVDDFGITAKGTELVAARAIAIIEALGRGGSWAARARPCCVRLFVGRPCLPGSLPVAEGGEVDAVDAVGLAAHSGGEQLVAV
jgi:hypothetical protein